MERGGRLAGRQDELSDLVKRARAGSTGVVVVGGAKVGKSCLMNAVVERLRRETKAVISLVGTASAQPIMFGALSRFIDPSFTREQRPVELLQEITTAIVAKGGGTAPVLVIDDIVALDVGSRAVVDRLVRNEGLTLIASHCSDEPLTDWLEGLVGARHLELRTLAPLDARACHQITAQLLDGPISERAVESLWLLSEGNPFVLRELIADSVASGALVDAGDVWRLVDPPSMSDRLRAHLDRRIALFDSLALDALRAIAVAGSLELPLLERFVDAKTIEALEHSRSVAVKEQGARLCVQLSSPLLADYLRASAGVVSRRRISSELAQGLGATQCRRSDDTLRLARWRLHAGSLDDAALATSAAAAALDRGDDRLAEKLARAALALDGSWRNLLVLARVALDEERLDDCRRVLEEVDQHVISDRDRVDVAFVRSCYLRRSDQDLAGAAGVISAALEALSTPESIQQARAELADIWLEGGLVQRAIAECSRIPIGETVNESDVYALSVGAQAHLMGGALTEAKQRVELARTLRRSDPYVGDRTASHSLNDARWPLIDADIQMYAGHLDRSLAICAAEIGMHGVRDVRRGSLLALQARVEMMTGDISASLESHRQSVAELHRGDPLFDLPIAQASALLALAQTGDGALLDVELAAVADQLATGRIEAQVLIERVRAWSICLAGEAESAAEKSLKTGLMVGADGAHLLAVFALYDAVRFGCAGAVSDELIEIGSLVDGALAASLVAHARAAANDDVAGLIDVAARFSSLGVCLLAAEAELSAARLLADAGDVSLSRRAVVRSTQLLAQCPGALTPLTVHREAVLTERQNEVARLAAHHSNTEIAERLSISVRTVENHLQTTYDRLDIHGRGGLRQLFGQPG